MIELGKMQQLSVSSICSKGALLTPADRLDNVLLPKKQWPAALSPGQELTVFVYTDENGDLLATAQRPKLIMGELGFLKAVSITNFGAFLDWGLPKDLLLANNKQIGKVKKGDDCMVTLYINQQGKLCASMRIYELLKTDAPYKPEDIVWGTVYRLNAEMGAFVAVEDQYHGFIHRQEFYQDLAVGDRIKARVKRTREDGKLELALRQRAYQEIEGDAQKILDNLRANGGVLPINDDSSPEQIKKLLQMSKRAFKRATGRLLKEGAVTITEDGLKSNW